MRILLIEDEAELAATIRTLLEREQYIVDWADCLSFAAEAARGGAHDLVILDRTLPDGDGLTLIPALRATNSGVPIIILSARNELTDRIAGLDEGADDYLAKPFAFQELLARIRAVRRRPGELHLDEVRIGELVFDMTFEEARVGELRLELPRRETCVLATLVRRRGRTVLRETLERAVYGFDDEVQSNTLDSHISRLRRKLADAGAGVEIHAIRGVGYLLRDSA
ncbi:response regulator [Altererythrobacter xixiisoli]|uniref:Response regulator n=1 Tax=Croceibacterium xixiisoli TaxID=1476466 RepID=A0A6I4TV88_9SPHN|nr:response regulator transcription factor [Croceibacterium xixiisoli]MXO98508.1 response regulator [Croceibacterium xixiisoli]